MSLKLLTETETKQLNEHVATIMGWEQVDNEWEMPNGDWWEVLPNFAQDVHAFGLLMEWIGTPPITCCDLLIGFAQCSARLDLRYEGEGKTLGEALCRAIIAYSGYEKVIGDKEATLTDNPSEPIKWVCSKPSHAGRGCKVESRTRLRTFMDCGYLGTPKIESIPKINADTETTEAAMTDDPPHASLIEATEDAYRHTPKGICTPCAEAKDGTWPVGHMATFWQGYCLVCGQIKSVCAESDWNFPGERRTFLDFD